MVCMLPTVGICLLERLHDPEDWRAAIEDVSGKGLMLAIEMFEDRD